MKIDICASKTHALLNIFRNSSPYALRFFASIRQNLPFLLFCFAIQHFSFRARRTERPACRHTSRHADRRTDSRAPLGQVSIRFFVTITALFLRCCLYGAKKYFMRLFCCAPEIEFDSCRGPRSFRQSFCRPNDRFLPLACRPKSPSVALPLRLSPRSPKPYTRSTARPKAAHDLSRATRFTFPRLPCGVQRGRSSALPTRSPQANQLPASGLPLAACKASSGPPLRRMRGFVRPTPRHTRGFAGFPNPT